MLLFSAFFSIQKEKATSVGKYGSKLNKKLIIFFINFLFNFQKKKTTSVIKNTNKKKYLFSISKQK